MTQIDFHFTPRQVAILGAVLSCCNGWQDPRELRRFVNIAADHVTDGWTEAEMESLQESLSDQWLRAQILDTDGLLTKSQWKAR